MELKTGEKAPDFKLEDQNGEWRELKDYRGKWVLVYFYPKDDTPGCTKEACNMRDNFSQFNRMNLQVLGISKDDTKSHKKFAEKYELQFPLLSDTTTEVNKLYDVWKPKKFMGKEFLGTMRTSFLINPEGRVAKIYENVKPEGHAEEVMKDIQ
ncbi:MAG TPA: thioredoxin-dependent thiol peroxidase [Patescibacteria group bacterium]